MALLSGSALRNYIVNTFKRDDKDTEIYEAITDTIYELRRRFPFEIDKFEAFATGISSLGDYKVGVPSDLGHMLADVRVLDGSASWPLVKRTKAQFDKLYPNPNDTNVAKSKPTDFCHFGTELLLGPVPDDITYQYEVSYSNEPGTDIISTSTNVPFSGTNREMLKHGVLKRIYADMGNTGAATVHAGQFEFLFQQEMARESKNTYAPPQQNYRDLV